MIWHFFLSLRLTAIQRGIFALLGGLSGPNAPYHTDNMTVRGRQVVLEAADKD